MEVKFGEVVGAVLAIFSLGIVGYAAIIQSSEMALGGALLLVGGSNSFFLRGKVQNPSENHSDLETTQRTTSTVTKSTPPDDT